MGRKIDTITFDEFCCLTAEISIDKKIKIHNDDQVLLCCGYEGKGKSTFSLALTCETYRKLGKLPTKDVIAYTWEEYQNMNIQAAVKHIDQLPNKEMAMAFLKEYGIEDVKGEKYKELFKKDYKIEKGSIILYDEAGTQANARDAMTRESKDFTKLLIMNRFLGLFHILNVPKPQSIDVYPREQRARGMVWCVAEYTRNADQRMRGVYYYEKDQYSEIFCKKNWWNLFSNDDKLISVVPPSFKIELPTDLRPYIPADITEYYDSKKGAFALSTMLTTWLETQNGGRNFNEDKLVKPGESKSDWFARTKCNPGYYSQYKNILQ